MSVCTRIRDQKRVSTVAALGALLLLGAALQPDEAQAGFLDELFGGGATQESAAPPQPRMQRMRRGDRIVRASPEDEYFQATSGERRRRHASLNNDPHLSGEVSTGEWRANRARKTAKNDGKSKRAAGSAHDDGATIGKYVCVRMCDGAVVSLARRSGGPEMPTCDNACPGSEARLFTLPSSGDDINNAIDSVEKISYADLVARIKTASGEKKACACGSVTAKDNIGVDDFFADATLRRGDVVATSEGLRIFHGAGRLPHKDGDFLAFAETRGRLPRTTHFTLEAIDQKLKTARTIDFSQPDK